MTELLDEYHGFTSIKGFSLDAGLATLHGSDSLFEGCSHLN